MTKCFIVAILANVFSRTPRSLSFHMLCHHLKLQKSDAALHYEIRLLQLFIPNVLFVRPNKGENGKKTFCYFSKKFRSVNFTKEGWKFRKRRMVVLTRRSCSWLSKHNLSLRRCNKTFKRKRTVQQPWRKELLVLRLLFSLSQAEQCHVSMRERYCKKPFRWCVHAY